MFKADAEMGPWSWFVEKILPALFLAISASVTSAAFMIYQSVAELTNTVKRHDREIELLRVEIKAAVTQQQLLETLKRVEQQLQIVLLQSGIKTKVEIK
jgi:hypothetical protein